MNHLRSQRLQVRGSILYVTRAAESARDRRETMAHARTAGRANWLRSRAQREAHLALDFQLRLEHTWPGCQPQMMALFTLAEAQCRVEQGRIDDAMWTHEAGKRQRMMAGLFP